MGTSHQNTNNNFFLKICDIIVEAKSDTVIIQADEISLDSDLSEPPLALDSIDFVRVILGIEETFGILADDEDFLASSVRTVGDLIEMVKCRLEQEQK